MDQYDFFPGCSALSAAFSSAVTRSSSSGMYASRVDEYCTPGSSAAVPKSLAKRVCCAVCDSYVLPFRSLDDRLSSEDDGALLLVEAGKAGAADADAAEVGARVLLCACRAEAGLALCDADAVLCAHEAVEAKLMAEKGRRVESNGQREADTAHNSRDERGTTRTDGAAEGTVTHELEQINSVSART